MTSDNQHDTDAPRVPGKRVDPEAEGSSSGFSRRSTNLWSPRQTAALRESDDDPSQTSRIEDELETVDVPVDDLDVYESLIVEDQEQSVPPPLPEDQDEFSLHDAARRLTNRSPSPRPGAFQFTTSHQTTATGIQLPQGQRDENGETAGQELPPDPKAPQHAYDVSEATRFRDVAKLLYNLSRWKEPHVVDWFDGDQHHIGTFVGTPGAICPGVMAADQLAFSPKALPPAMRHTLESLASSGRSALELAGDSAWDGLVASRKQLDLVRSMTAGAVQQLCSRATHYVVRPAPLPTPGPVVEISHHALLGEIGKRMGVGASGPPAALFDRVKSTLDSWLIAWSTPIGAVPAAVSMPWDLEDFEEAVATSQIARMALAKARGTTVWLGDELILACSWNERFATVLRGSSNRFGWISRVIQDHDTNKG